jgi:hypothetical protein
MTCSTNSKKNSRAVPNRVLKHQFRRSSCVIILQKNFSVFVQKNLQSTPPFPSMCARFTCKQRRMFRSSRHPPRFSRLDELTPLPPRRAPAAISQLPPRGSDEDLFDESLICYAFVIDVRLQKGGGEIKSTK